MPRARAPSARAAWSFPPLLLVNHFRSAAPAWGIVSSARQESLLPPLLGRHRCYRAGRRPRAQEDAASLILWRGRRGTGREVLMGVRSARHRFMPSRLVLPGGRADAADRRAPAVARPLPAATRAASGASGPAPRWPMGRLQGRAARIGGRRRGFAPLAEAPRRGRCPIRATWPICAGPSRRPLLPLALQRPLSHRPSRRPPRRHTGGSGELRASRLGLPRRARRASNRPSSPPARAGLRVPFLACYPACGAGGTSAGVVSVWQEEPASRGAIPPPAGRHTGGAARGLRGHPCAGGTAGPQGPWPLPARRLPAEPARPLPPRRTLPSASSFCKCASRLRPPPHEAGIEPRPPYTGAPAPPLWRRPAVASASRIRASSAQGDGRSMFR